jgi:hypothetical protein
MTAITVISSIFHFLFSFFLSFSLFFCFIEWILKAARKGVMGVIIAYDAYKEYFSPSCYIDCFLSFKGYDLCLLYGQ